MKRSVATIGLVGLLLCLGTVPAAEPDYSPYAYHLRIVRVSGAGSDPGAALGWRENGGIPVVLPDAEAWGTADQIDALAQTLGGQQVDAVTGYYVQAAGNGAHFERRVYVAGSVVDLSFEAYPPAGNGTAHLVTLKLDSPELDEPMAEARLLVRTSRTVAIASPSPAEDDWLVLAVTLVDQQRVKDLRQTVEKTHKADEPGMVMPKLIHKVAPRYPEGARKDRVEGEVAVIATIDRQGIPRAPAVFRMSPGTEELAAAAVDAVQAWRYEPATLNGEPVEVEFSIFVRFALE